MGTIQGTQAAAVTDARAVPLARAYRIEPDHAVARTNGHDPRQPIPETAQPFTPFLSEDVSHASPTDRGRPSILVVDDCALYREALAANLRMHGLPYVRAVWDLTSLIAALESFEPDVILLNVATHNLPLLLRAATSLSAEAPVIAVAASEDVEDAVIACAEAGVAGYHLRTDSLNDLLILIGEVTAGKAQCPPEVSALLLRRLSELASYRQPVPKDPVLTARENQILGMLELGQSNHDIADELSIAVHTVKNHVHSLLTKLGVGTRAEAAALAHSMRVGRDAQEGPRPRSSQIWPS